jgi:hypothetical protein
MHSAAPTSCGISISLAAKHRSTIKSEQNDIKKTDTVQIQNRFDRKNGNRGVHAETAAKQ